MEIDTLAEAESIQLANKEKKQEEKQEEKQLVTKKTETAETGTNTENDTVNLVDNYILNNILQSKLWDSATLLVKGKAVNNAIRVLKTVLNKQYKDIPPIEHIAEQAIWLLKMDDSFQRMQLGATSITCDGVTISFKEKDNSIAPYVLQALCLPAVSRRRVGAYSSAVQFTQRRLI